MSIALPLSYVRKRTAGLEPATDRFEVAVSCAPARCTRMPPEIKSVTVVRIRTATPKGFV